MNPTRILTLVAAAAMIIVAIIFSATRGGNDSPSTSTPGGTTVASNADTVVVEFAYSPEKDLLLKPLLEEFNNSRTTVNGRVVKVSFAPKSSGAMTDKLSKGEVKLALWSPSSSLWGRIVNFRTDTKMVADENPSLVRTPLVIAMAEPLARALGWPRQQIGWSDLIAEARSPEGWARHGHPEWGAFKFGQTNPDYSTSGLSATVAEYLAAAGKTEGLTLADIKAPKVRQTVVDLQRSVVHYGDTTPFFAEQLAEFGPTYVSAIAMEEVTLLDFNTRLRKPNQDKLVAFYPKEGTFYSDNPLIIPDAPWMDDDTRAAAAKVVEFLTAKVTPEMAAKYLFRPADATKKPADPISAANNVDPAQPTRTLSLPEPKVLNTILTAWREDRKPAHLEIVVDVSGSMADSGKLDAAKRGLELFLTLLQPQDEVGLSVFSNKARLVSAPVPMRSGRRDLINKIRGLNADGGTAVYDATKAAVDRIGANADTSKINAVVVLTDGADNESSITPAELGSLLKANTGSEGGGVRVFTIAYGSDAQKDVLTQIAKDGRGKSYAGDPSTIEAVYTQISSFF